MKAPVRPKQQRSVGAVEQSGKLPADLTTLSIEELMEIEVPSVQGILS
jgi:hypothetical protein